MKSGRIEVGPSKAVGSNDVLRTLISDQAGTQPLGALAATTPTQLPTSGKEALELLAAKQAAQQAIQAKRDELPEWITRVSDLDWKKLPPPITAMLLTKRPFPPAAKALPDRYMTPHQAIFVALWLYRHGFDLSGHQWWYNFETNSPEMTVEGKLDKARREGWKLGAPRLGRTPVDRKQPLEGYECALPVKIEGEWQEFRYYADIRLFGVNYDGNPKKGLWSNPAGAEHMLGVRAFDGCLKQIGYGFSEPIEGSDQTVTAIDIPVVTPSYRELPKGEQK